MTIHIIKIQKTKHNMHLINQIIFHLKYKIDNYRCQILIIQILQNQTVIIAQMQKVQKQKRIKYQQFIQDFHNSSRSSNSNNDQSILSQRSFRDSKQNGHAYKKSKGLPDNQQIKLEGQDNQQNIPMKSNRQQKYQISKNNCSSTLLQETKKDKLYTFCDIKNTQKSVQIVVNQNKKQSKNTSLSYIRPSYKLKDNRKLCLGNNQRKKHIQTGFQGKVLKTQSQLNSQSAIKMLDQSLQNTKMLSSIQSRNSQRKIQSVKKVLINSNSKKLQSESKNKNNSQIKQSSTNKTNTQVQGSSKKKIVSLNIKKLKPSLQINPKKLKLSVQNSLNTSIQINEDKTMSKMSSVNNILISDIESNMEEQNDNNIRAKNQNQNQNMNNSNNITLSDKQLRNFTSKFAQQKYEKDQQNLSLQKIISQQSLNVKQLKAEIVNLKQKLVLAKGQNKQIQVLRRDSLRLLNSYKDIKTLYEKCQNQQYQKDLRIKSLQDENTDLKDCMQFQKQQIEQLTNQIQQQQNKIQCLQKKQGHLPKSLEGLSGLIKQKIQSYEDQISMLISENNKLNLLKEKLQNYNQTLKSQIQDKDEIIQSLEQHNKVADSLKRSYRQDFVEQRTTQSKLTTIIKQLQGKLKLTNIHNEYLTKELHYFKHQKNTQHTQNTQQSPKFLKPNHSLGKTITTRNSSMYYANLDTINKVTEQDQIMD